MNKRYRIMIGLITINSFHTLRRAKRFVHSLNAYSSCANIWDNWKLTWVEKEKEGK